ncbi:hypothetical protein AAMO2058_001343900, partial [Amorphochlora amoebiformis]
MFRRKEYGVIIDTFDEKIKEKKFLEAVSEEELMYYLDQDDLRVNEIDLFEFCVKWIRHHHIELRQESKRLKLETVLPALNAIDAKTNPGHPKNLVGAGPAHDHLPVETETENESNVITINLLPPLEDTKAAGEDSKSKLVKLELKPSLPDRGIKGTRLRKAMARFLPKIRFGSMSPYDFATRVDPLEILTVEEMENVYIAIGYRRAMQPANIPGDILKSKKVSVKAARIGYYTQYERKRNTLVSAN